MPCRDWLIKARLQHNWTRAQAARKARISERLYTWLEIDDEIITHPNFVRRIKRMYHLTDAQFNSMVNAKHHIGRSNTADNEIEQDKGGMQA